MTGIKALSPEYMARFASAAYMAYKAEKGLEALEGRKAIRIMMNEIIAEGSEFLRRPQPRDSENLKFVPYRRFVKALFLQVAIARANNSDPLEHISTSTPYNGTYEDEHIAAVKEYMKAETMSNKLQLVFVYSEYLAVEGMQKFFDLISEETGDTTVNMGDDGTVKLMDRVTWRIRDYFETHFFPSLRQARGKARVESRDGSRVEKPLYMVLLKFICDSVLYALPRKMDIQTGTYIYSANKVDKRSWKHTAEFIEQIYYVWNIFMKRCGFADLEDVLRLFLYYDEETGKLKCLNGNQVFARSSDIYVPVNPGIRAKSIGLAPRKTIEMMLEDVPAVGIDRADLGNDVPFKFVKTETYESVCEYINYFLDDVYNVVYHPSVLLAGDGNVKEFTSYSRYKMEDERGRFPSRFGSFEQEIPGIREDVLGAERVSNAAVEETTAEAYYPQATIENAETAVIPFNCDPVDCPCNEVKADVAYKGVNFPNILVSTTEKFVKKVEKDITKRNVSGKVQLIITDPYNYIENQPQLKAEDIGLIVLGSNELLQNGGHVFIKTTLQHASSVAMAFKKAKGDAGQEVFTVDEAAFHIMASPEDHRGHIGTDGPTASPVTLTYIHAMKLGAATRSEAHENAKTRNYGHTDSRYHSSTNVIDGAVELREHGYDLSLAGAKEMVSRYSSDNDIVVDFFSEESWIPTACISLKQSRFYAGAVTTEENKNKLNGKLAECLIYQSGQRQMTSHMGYTPEFLESMKEIYESHNFEDRYNPIYGIGMWIDTREAAGSLPILTTLPEFILDHACVLRSDPTFASQATKRQSPNHMLRDIGRTLMYMNAGEPLRFALINDRMYMDKNSPYTKEGLRMGHVGEQEDFLGYISGIVINGGWEENQKVLKGLGKGLFENDEYTVEKKSISLKDVFVIKDGEDYELDDLNLIPSKFCPYRYAIFQKTGGNATIKVNGGKGIGRKELHQHMKYEVILTKKAIIGEPLIINTSIRRELKRRERERGQEMQE